MSFSFLYRKKPLSAADRNSSPKYLLIEKLHVASTQLYNSSNFRQLFLKMCPFYIQPVINSIDFNSSVWTFLVIMESRPTTYLFYIYIYILYSIFTFKLLQSFQFSSVPRIQWHWELLLGKILEKRTCIGRCIRCKTWCIFLASCGMTWPNVIQSMTHKTSFMHKVIHNYLI